MKCYIRFEKRCLRVGTWVCQIKESFIIEINLSWMRVCWRVYLLDRWSRQQQPFSIKKLQNLTRCKCNNDDQNQTWGEFHFSIQIYQFQFQFRFYWLFFYLLLFTMSRYSEYLLQVPTWNTSWVVYIPSIVMEEIFLN